MVEQIKMPKLSPTMRSGTMVKWHKAIQDPIEEGDLLFEVATDKATVEHHALDEGYLLAILVPEGSKALLGEVIALFGERPDEDVSSELKKLEDAAHEKQNKKQTAREEVQGEEEQGEREGSLASLGQEHIPISEPLTGWHFEFPSSEEGQEGDRRASPYARILAKELHVDLRTLKGSGPHGRIVASDVQKAAKVKGENSAVDLGFPLSLGVGTKPHQAPGSYRREELSAMRSAIARRLQQSKTFIPHFYVKINLDLGALLALRLQLKEVGLKVSVNDLFLRASALALKAHPAINVGYDSATEEMIHFETVDVAMAVSVEGGLITPILRHCDAKNLQQIAQQTKELASKAREGKLEREEYEGGSFTVSNLGMFGVSDFQAIINPPQGAILAIGAPQERVRLEGERAVSYPELCLTLSCDHRIIDGASAAQFLQTIKALVSRPTALLMI